MTSGLVAGIAIVALCLAVIAIITILGVMREVVRLQGEIVDRAVPFEPAYIGSEVPSELSLHLRNFDPSLEDRQFVLLFLSESCSPCANLLINLRRPFDREQHVVIDRGILTVVSGEGHKIRDELRSLGIPVINNVDPGTLFQSAAIFATPSALRITAPGFVASEYRNGVEAKWLIKQVGLPEGSDVDVRQV